MSALKTDGTDKKLPDSKRAASLIIPVQEKDLLYTEKAKTDILPDLETEVPLQHWDERDI